MTHSSQRGPNVPTERPDPKAAARDPMAPDAKNRPGFDLGGKVGSEGDSTAGSNTVPGGPKGSAASGNDGSGRADGLTDPKGSRPSSGGGNPGGSAAGGRL